MKRIDYRGHNIKVEKAKDARDWHVWINEQHAHGYSTMARAIKDAKYCVDWKLDHKPGVILDEEQGQ